jgi:pyruvate, orthophosphate dikinase
MLQCRKGKRASLAAVAIACALVDEGLVSIPEAITMVTPSHLTQLLRPHFINDAQYTSSVIGYGTGTAPGAAVGSIVFDCLPDTASGQEDLQGYILVKQDTCSAVRTICNFLMMLFF